MKLVHYNFMRWRGGVSLGWEWNGMVEGKEKNLEIKEGRGLTYGT